MTILTNSIRPSQEGKAVKTAGPAYSAYKLQGSCSKCSDRTYQTVATGHPVFKMMCPTCKAWLDERKAKAAAAKQLDANKLLPEKTTP